MTEADVAEDLAEQIRDRIIEDPDVILGDRDVMRALVAANDRAMGENIVDLRGVAMARLEARLGRLEDTHRSVIAAAYENLAGTHQIHRAVLRLLEPVDFEAFLQVLGSDVARILRVDSLRLVLETRHEADEAAGNPALRRLGEVLCLAEPGFIESCMGRGAAPAAEAAPDPLGEARPDPQAAARLNALPPGRREEQARPGRTVVLRRSLPEWGAIHGTAADIGSEALLRLDLGPDRLPGMLVLGAEDPRQFRATHGTDLLAFFAGAFERAMRRWLG